MSLGVTVIEGVGKSSINEPVKGQMQVLGHGESSDKASFGIFSSTLSSSSSDNSTTIFAADIVQDDSFRFILIPLAVLLVILLLSAAVYMMARNRRRFARVYCKRKLARNFGHLEDDSDSAMEQGDVDDYDFDDPTECLLKGKLQIDNRYETYQTTLVPPVAANRRELYT